MDCGSNEQRIRKELSHLKTAMTSPSFRRFLAVFGVLSLLTTLWSLASPLMSVPDEPAHVIKAAAVVRGQLQGVPGAGQGDMAQVEVPLYIADTLALSGCFAFKPAVPAECSPELQRSASMVKAFTSAGNYNPMYYAAAGMPSLLISGAEAIYAMRIVGALLSAAFLALSLTALAGLRHWRLTVFVGFTALTPMVFFLSGAVNPNALEIATCLAVFCGLCLSWDRVEGNGRWRVPLSMAAVSAVVLANTRAAALLWLALAVAASLILFGVRPLVTVLRTKFGWAATVAVGVGALMSLLWLWSADSLKSLAGKGFDESPLAVAAFMIHQTFDFARGYVLYLGWLDTPGPSGVQAIWATLIVGAIVLSFLAATARGRLAVALLVTAVILLPPILQIPLVQKVGIIWQGRYILALVVVLIAACGVAMRSFSRVPDGLGRKVSAAILVVMVIGHFYSFIYGLRRYVVGIDDTVGWAEMFSEPRWQPPFGWGILSAFYLAVLIAGASLLHWWVNTKQTPQSHHLARNSHTSAD